MMRKSLMINKSSAINFDNSKWNINQQVQECLTTLQKWRQNAISRKQLAEMTPYQLHDIGITELQARDEARKFFWQ
ncbi:protein of unknown function [Desulfuromusa kysingii]|uniref:YjiS-like domain-containing protein n=1 Tax=Desulfuromusa kysingii TaxID=37625 RepID=A0A1H3YC54_9BACT|nr:DUF1127 domain-containing protein [Desulfuromusa kysingii]SEA08604.1 protein of unknown function [Desulfuromusa kysingii]